MDNLDQHWEKRIALARGALLMEKTARKPPRGAGEGFDNLSLMTSCRLHSRVARATRRGALNRLVGGLSRQTSDFVFLVHDEAALE